MAGLVYLLPLTLALYHPGRAYTRHAIAIGQMLTPSLFIFLTGRGFETHFFVFGALASLAAYRDIKVLLTATVVVALDDRLGHWVQTIFMTEAYMMPWTWLEFTGWVLFEDTLLALWIWESLRLMGGLARHQAEEEILNEIVAREVAERIEVAQTGKHPIPPGANRPGTQRSEVPFLERVFALRHFPDATSPASAFTAIPSGCR